MSNISLIEQTSLPQLYLAMQQIIYAGVYNVRGGPLHPYEAVKYSLAKVYPPTAIGAPPQVVLANKKSVNLFTSQPTIYQNQTEIMSEVDNFLRDHNLKINDLHGAIKYHWPDRGDFHILPPIIEKHTYTLNQGFIDLADLSRRFHGAYIRDARGKLHNLGERYLEGFYIDEVSKVDHLDIFHSHASIINYGLQNTGQFDFYVICDGSHRVDYSLEVLQEPVTVIVIEPIEGTFLPYYAFPVSFWPTMRLSSKQSEKMYVRLERDKIHLLHDLINKVLRYDWTMGGLMVSKLRSNKDIY